MLAASAAGAISGATASQAIATQAASPPLKPSQLLSIVDFGAREDASDNSRAIERAVKAGMASGRAVEIPPGVFTFSNIDLGRNDATEPARLALVGQGTLRSTISGIAITASRGQFYDLVIDGVRFESKAGAGTCLIDGDAFRRLIFSPGTQIDQFDWVIRATDYLQTVRMIGTIIRGGAKAVVQSPMAYDCTFAHNIIEFVTDAIVIDGSNDPAVHTCRIVDNLIEGLGGRAITLGACVATTISGNYFEENQGGDIRLDAGSAPHKGLTVQNNSIQLAKTRRDAGHYGVVWGKSTALPVRAGGNFSTGNLHDTRGVTGLIDMSGDFAAGELYSGYETETSATRAPVGRAIYSDGLASHWAWFDRYMTIDPYLGELRFGGQFDSILGNAAEPPVIAYGRASPEQDPRAYERKRWARGSVVFNAEPARGKAFGWICLRAGEPGQWEDLKASGR